MIRRRTALIGLLLATVIVWIIPGPVVEHIANDRHTMLGRYSRTQFSWIIALTLISILGIYIDRARGEKYKRRWFQVLSVVLFLFPVLAILDFSLRTPERLHYVRESLAYHHPPNFDSTVDIKDASLSRFDDKPEAARTYPNATPGYPTIYRTLRTDARGYRNRTTLDQAEIVALGDSFTEGSGVSDEHPWPVRLAELTGRSVCNLGMSGYDPLNYLAALKEHGIGLRPKYVICVLYEGNDFRSSAGDRERFHPSFFERLSTYMQQSPLLGLADRMMIGVFGPINSRGPVKGAEVLDWLPIRIPPGDAGKAYAFAPKQLRDRMKDAEQFSIDPKWLNTRRILLTLRDVCRDAGAELVVVYAPTKAHVIVPLVADRLPADKVRVFTAMSFKGPMPDASTFMSALLDRLDDTEQVVRDYCEREAIHFVSTTETLRATAAEGTQVYFTYDQHWTPEGHAAAAKVIAETLKSAHRQAPAAGATSGDGA